MVRETVERCRIRMPFGPLSMGIGYIQEIGKGT